MTENYYKLWHNKRGVWIDCGDLPICSPIYGSHPRPFIVNLDEDKWGLKKGSHVFIIETNDTERKLLRFRNIGARIPISETGYIHPNYKDSVWEILDTWSDPDWYYGSWIFSKAIYRKAYGLVFDYQDVYDEENNTSKFWCWNGPGITYTIETSPSETTRLTPNHGYVFPFNNTLNHLLGCYFQGLSETAPGTWSERRPIFFNPSNINDSQPWDIAGSYDNCPYSWYTGPIGSFPSFSGLYTSNFFILTPTFTEWYYHENEYPNPPSLSLIFGPMYLFKAPNIWIDIGETPNYNGVTWDQLTSIENSVFDWKNDCAAMTSNMKEVYVKRKSDGTIWRYYDSGNQNPFAIQEKPVNPVQGITYANFFCGSPPVAPNNTWDSLIVIK